MNRLAALYNELISYSIWSNADHLYDDIPRHWSGTSVGLAGMLRIDGKTYRY